MSLPGFPPPSPASRIISFAALVQDADKSRDVPVTYVFGGQGPTTVPANQASQPYITGSAARMFVEYDPYYWLPA